MAFTMAQEAIQIKEIVRSELFTISGKAHFTDRRENKIWRPKTMVYVTIEDYPASFVIAKHSSSLNATSFATAIDTLGIARVSVPRNQLAMLYTRTAIKLYELAGDTGKVVFSLEEALQRDRAAQRSLYIQAILLFLGGLVLLVVPKKYLLKD